MNWKEELQRFEIEDEPGFAQPDIYMTELENFIETEVIEKLIEDAVIHQALGPTEMMLKLTAKWRGKE